MFFHCALSARGGSGSAALVFPAGNGRSMIACVRLTIFDRPHACHMGRKVAAYKQAQDELRPSNGQFPSMKGQVDNFSVTAGALVDARFGSLPRGLRRRNSHDLSALRAAQRPRVGMAWIVGRLPLHGHVEVPPVGQARPPMMNASSADRARLYKIAQQNPEKP
jgi:hypothetical protein